MTRKFTGKTRIFLAISGVIIVVALIMQICGAGINLGIDFTGGSLLSYSVGESYDVEDLDAILHAAGYSDYQVTKIAPSDANVEESEIEAGESEAIDALAQTETADGETAAEDEANEEETPYEGILNLDKSGIKDDGLTDLQIRLDLVDETEGLEDAVESAVTAIFDGAEKTSYKAITNIMINDMDFDAEFAGGYMAEFETGVEFDSDAAAEKIMESLIAAEYAVNDVEVYRYDVAAEAAAEAAEAEASEETETADEAEAADEAEVADEDEVADETENADEEEAAEETEEVEETGTSMRVLVSINDQTSQVRKMVETEMKAKYPEFKFVSIDHVSAVAGKDLISNALFALLIAFACMLIYIAIRFDFYSGVVAMGALLHDVLIMFAFMVFFSWKYQANSPFIAAVLTIVGYSINNTIIIFDRIRENTKKPGFTMMPKIDVAEKSVGECLSRTINTSVTTLITLVALYIFGVESIREFAFPLLVGMLAGTYSSVLLSGQVWAMWVDKMNAGKLAKEKKAKAN